MFGRETEEYLAGFAVVESDDSVKVDRELTCRDCGEVLCDIEPGDSLGTLVLMALDHEC